MDISFRDPYMKQLLDEMVEIKMQTWEHNAIPFHHCVHILPNINIKSELDHKLSIFSNKHLLP